MPFDALAMRAVQARWESRLVGSTCVRMQEAKDRLLLTLKKREGSENVLIVLQPGIGRLHRTSLTNLSTKHPLTPWLKKLLPFTVREIQVPPFERVMRLRIEHPDDWNMPIESELIIELAGHLTNLILLDSSSLVIDAWRKIAPGRPGRTIWPKLPYMLPPAPGNPLETQNARDLPPFARQWLSQGGTFSDLERDWTKGFPDPTWTLRQSPSVDVWVYPVSGYENEANPDFEDALDKAFRHKEALRQEEAVKHQLLAKVDSRAAHLSEKLAQYYIDQRETGEVWKELGDLWLTYQYAFHRDPALREITVAGYDGTDRTLRLPEDETPSGQAALAYRRFKKLKARQVALTHLIPRLEAELNQLIALRQDASQQHPIEWYTRQLKNPALPRLDAPERTLFRHFQSLHGLDIFVGRSREENARLTFQKARPDDIWFHTKQAPGSHVILVSGKHNPDLEDMLDAAQLAVFFSSAQGSSHVPVDYTRRKFVRKRPHAEPGQVLYQREKTLYITPDQDRLKRLGAVSEKLVGG